jgi:hypothetical protein
MSCPQPLVNNQRINVNIILNVTQLLVGMICDA